MWRSDGPSNLATPQTRILCSLCLPSYLSFKCWGGGGIFQPINEQIINSKLYSQLTGVAIITVGAYIQSAYHHYANFVGKFSDGLLVSSQCTNAHMILDATFQNECYFVISRWKFLVSAHTIDGGWRCGLCHRLPGLLWRNTRKLLHGTHLLCVPYFDIPLRNWHRNSWLFEARSFARHSGEGLQSHADRL